MEQLPAANGVNGTNGTYLLASADAADFVASVQGAVADTAEAREAKHVVQRRDRAAMDVREGLDPKTLAEVGWGLVFPAEAEAHAVAEVKEALAPLIAWRREQASRLNESFFQVYEAERGFRADDSKSSFLRRQGAGIAAADPRQMPYYLLLAGTPEAISFRVQYQLDVQRAVGRLAFDRAEDYAQYADNVIAAEKASAAAPPRVLFFGPRNPDDVATGLSAEHLLQPLADWALQNGYRADSIIGEAATKARLREVLSDAAPQILFTASHGMAFSPSDARLARHQGALLCQDWPGPIRHRGAIPESFYFSADDIPQAGSMAGTIIFLFACFSLGTPDFDEFAAATPRRLAHHPFIAALPQQMLARPGGPLAVIGHVDRAWGYSFYEVEAGRQLAAFEDLLKRLIEGHPIGSALEPMNDRYAELATMLSEELTDRRFGKQSSDAMLAGLWTACHDARNYAVLGDPAVRLSRVQD